MTNEFINTGLLNSSFSFFFVKFDKVHFDGYDRRYGDDGIHERLQWEDNEVGEISDSAQVVIQRCDMLCFGNCKACILRGSCFIGIRNSTNFSAP